MKIGILCECGRDGADLQVVRYIVEHWLNGELGLGIELKPKPMDNKRNLIQECGDVVDALIEIDKCDRVVVLWDLAPAWPNNSTPSKRRELALVEASLEKKGIDKSKYTLVCIQWALETWLIADHNAVNNCIEAYKPTHGLNDPMKRNKDPEQTPKDPKGFLIDFFKKELGKGRRYNDLNHAIKIAKKMKNRKEIGRVSSFKEFWKAMGGGNL